MFVLPVHAVAQAFSFAAIGDTPYVVPRQLESFARLIERINGVAPAFTVHVGDIKGGSTPLGSNNNLQRDAAALGEYAERNAANLAWIRSTFAAASKSKAKALVLIFHGDPGWELEGREDQRSGFSDTLRVLKADTLKFARPCCSFTATSTVSSWTSRSTRVGG